MAVIKRGSVIDRTLKRHRRKKGGLKTSPAKPKNGNGSLAKTVKRLRDLTHDNDHTGALVVLAEFSGDRAAAKALKAMRELQDYFGQLPQGFGAAREKIANRLRARLRDQLRDGKMTQDAYNQLTGWS